MDKLDRKYYMKGYDRDSATYRKDEKILLLVVDEQPKLMNTMDKGEEAIANTLVLIKTFKEFNQPILATEQYPKGLGRSDDRILEELEEDQFIVKTVFDAARPEVIDFIEKENIKKVVITGAEGHICVYQTARTLLNKGLEVYLPVDAIASFKDSQKERAARTNENMGAVLVSTETILYDLAYDSKDPHFKFISNLVKELRK